MMFYVCFFWSVMNDNMKHDIFYHVKGTVRVGRTYHNA